MGQNWEVSMRKLTSKTSWTIIVMEWNFDVVLGKFQVTRLHQSLKRTLDWATDSWLNSQFELYTQSLSGWTLNLRDLKLGHPSLMCSLIHFAIEKIPLPPYLGFGPCFVEHLLLVLLLDPLQRPLSNLTILMCCWHRIRNTSVYIRTKKTRNFANFETLRTPKICSCDHF